MENNQAWFIIICFVKEREIALLFLHTTLLTEYSIISGDFETLM
jgi:hypothetical protein